MNDIKQHLRTLATITVIIAYFVEKCPGEHCIQKSQINKQRGHLIRLGKLCFWVQKWDWEGSNSPVVIILLRLRGARREGRHPPCGEIWETFHQELLGSLHRRSSQVRNHSHEGPALHPPQCEVRPGEPRHHRPPQAEVQSGPLSLVQICPDVNGSLICWRHFK